MDLPHFPDPSGVFVECFRKTATDLHETKCCIITCKIWCKRLRIGTEKHMAASAYFRRFGLGVGFEERVLALQELGGQLYKCSYEACKGHTGQSS